MGWFSNPNLGQGLGGWRALNDAPSVTFQTETDVSLARTSSSYAYARAAQGGASVALDFAYPELVVDYSTNTDSGDGILIKFGWQPPSFTIEAWTRVRPGAPNVSATLALWALGAQPQPHDTVGFIATQSWQAVTISGVNIGNRTRRIEIYLNTPNTDLLIDSVACF